MEIKNKTLTLNQIDIDHIVGEVINTGTVPPSVLILKGLRNELELSGITKEFNKIEILLQEGI